MHIVCNYGVKITENEYKVKEYQITSIDFGCACSAQNNKDSTQYNDTSRTLPTIGGRHTYFVLCLTNFF